MQPSWNTLYTTPKRETSNKTEAPFVCHHLWIILVCGFSDIFLWLFGRNTVLYNIWLIWLTCLYNRSLSVLSPLLPHPSWNWFFSSTWRFLIPQTPLYRSNLWFSNSLSLIFSHRFFFMHYVVIFMRGFYSYIYIYKHNW